MAAQKHMSMQLLTQGGTSCPWNAWAQLLHDIHFDVAIDDGKSMMRCFDLTVARRTASNVVEQVF